jgi:hypothetical protein
MKKSMSFYVVLLFICFLSIPSIVLGVGKIKYFNDKPKPGENITINFSTTENFESLDCYVYINELERETYVKKLPLKLLNDKWIANLPTNEKIVSLFCNIRDNGNIINNDFNYLLFFEGNLPMPYSSGRIADFLIEKKSAKVFWESNNSKALELFKNEFKHILNNITTINKTLQFNILNKYI